MVGAGFEFRLGDLIAAADFIVPIARGLPLMDYYVGRGKAAEPDSAAGRFFVRMADTGPTSESPGADCFTSAML